MEKSRPEYAVYRLRKIHVKNYKREFARVVDHNFRLSPVINADSSKSSQNRILLGPDHLGIEAASDALIAQHRDPNGYATRSSCIVVVEHVLSASRSFFFDQQDALITKNLERWVENSVAWLQQENKGTLISAVLHLDEQAPHVHALTVPLVDGRLYGSVLYGKKSHLSGLQNRYWLSVKDLGLSRGLRGSKATHTDQKEYQRRVASALDLQSADEIFQSLSKKLAKKHLLLLNAQEARRELNELMKLLKIARAKAVAYQSQKVELDAVLASRTLPLIEAKDLSLSHVMRKIEAIREKSQDRPDAIVYETAMGQRISLHEDFWINELTDQSGFGSIALVEHLLQLSPVEAHQWLTMHWGAEVADSAELARQHYLLSKKSRSQAMPYEFRAPQPLHQATVQSLHERLGQIDVALLTEHKADQTIYLDYDHNVIMLCYDSGKIRGAEVLQNETHRLYRHSSSQEPGYFRTPNLHCDTHSKLFVCPDAVSALRCRSVNGQSAISVGKKLGDKICQTLLNELLRWIKLGKSVYLCLSKGESSRLHRALEAALSSEESAIVSKKISPIKILASNWQLEKKTLNQANRIDTRADSHDMPDNSLNDRSGIDCVKLFSGEI